MGNIKSLQFFLGVPDNIKMKFSLKFPTSQKAWMIAYIFVAIFQPPIFSFSTIYLWGILTLILLMKDYKLNLALPSESKLLEFYNVLMLLSFYCVIISVFNILFIDSRDFYSNRIHWFARLFLMTPIELLFVWYIHDRCIKWNFSLQDIIDMVGIVGALQGCCAIAAYVSPQIRNFFLIHHQSIIKNGYFLSRRGYGLSGVLFDTFGYGMGLIAGIILLAEGISRRRKYVYITLSLIATFLNSRTGLLLFILAIVLYLCKSKNFNNTLLKIISTMILLFFVIVYVVEPLLVIGIKSDNVNISWASGALKNVLAFLNGEQKITEVSFLLGVDRFPTNVFDLIFGTGHDIFSVSKIIGFHSDVGYINMLWEFGIIGSAFFFICFMKLVKTALDAASYSEKFIGIFIMLSFLLVLMKANLIGYSPGIIVTYIVLFSFILRSSKRFNFDYFSVVKSKKVRSCDA